MDFEALFHASPNAYVVLDRELVLVEANETYLRTTGRRREEVIGRRLFDVFPHDARDPDNESVRLLRESFARVFHSGEPDCIAFIRYCVEQEGVPGEERFWSATNLPLRSPGGEVRYLLQHTMDVTALARLRARESGAAVTREQLESSVLLRARAVQAANAALALEHERLRTLFEQAPGFMAVLRGDDLVFELVNQAYVDLVGPRPLLGRSYREVFTAVELECFDTLAREVLRTGVAYVGHGMPILLQREGSEIEERWVDFVYQPLVEKDSTVSGIFVQGHDVTERRRAEQEVARYREHLEELVAERTRALKRSEQERRLAEAALRQSQKMEAVGRLTGGIAHDFNNLLQVIAGNLALLGEDVGANERARRRVQQAMDAVRRGSKLSGQLLAFARRQPLEPGVLDVGDLLREMEDLLQRALGEAVEIEIAIADDAWRTFVDRNQLENVILNLAINARDAMRGAGRLTLGVGNLVIAERGSGLDGVMPGDYVRLEVSDTGCGMPPEVLEHVFEPFFTTKREGHGTGLGLSMVYGFVLQSGGHVRVESEPGQGTTFELLLPRAFAVDDRDSAPREKTPVVDDEAGGSSRPLVGGTETILVVEDDAAVRSTVAELLGGLGYRVIEAEDAQRALAILERRVPIDLLFTDVVMPGSLASVELARRARELVPGLRVLFTSGYTDGALLRDGRLEPGVQLLRKPCGREELARKVRQVLDARPSRAAMPSPARALRVLVVDDDDDTRDMVTEILAELGHEARSASCAEDAWAALGAHETDLLLTDIGLPGSSGLELARDALKAHPALRVVIASGYGASAIPQGDALSRVVVLQKPYFPEQIAEALRAALREPVT